VASAGAETAALNYGILLAGHFRIKPVDLQRWLSTNIALQRPRSANADRATVGEPSDYFLWSDGSRAACTSHLLRMCYHFPVCVSSPDQVRLSNVQNNISRGRQAA
jgi:hypothetical protein